MADFVIPPLPERPAAEEVRAYLAELARRMRTALAAAETDAETRSRETQALRRDLDRTDEALRGASGRIGVLGRDRVIQGNEAPEDPRIGAIWLDTSGAYPAYRRYDGETWIPVTDYEKLAGDAERITRVENAVSEDGIAQLVSKSAVVGGAVKSIVSTAFVQGAEGFEARMTRVERGMEPVAEWIRFTVFEGESGLMIGRDGSGVRVFITNSELRILNGSDTAASFALNRAVMNDAVTRNGITLGSLRADWTDSEGAVLRPE